VTSGEVASSSPVDGGKYNSYGLENKLFWENIIYEWRLVSCCHVLKTNLLKNFYKWLNVLIRRRVVRVMVFNATFNNISVISWQAVLLVEETGVHGENHQLVASY
jgi:hypothetical protein